MPPGEGFWITPCQIGEIPQIAVVTAYRRHVRRLREIPRPLGSSRSASGQSADPPRERLRVRQDDGGNQHRAVRDGVPPLFNTLGALRVAIAAKQQD